ncbi:pectate lyase [Rhizoctonia solani]|uniref:Probable pectate lyase F n=1 Tax=Rhizoctonia solani TaxID=456999 RepID=A0A8H8P5F2_9AGAM|nr:pectate lyase [Rhizoctonia solani]QRW24158.1 pectate lyase [Rhizoctonia solani]
MVQLSLATFAIVAGMFAQTALAAPSEKRAASCSFPNPSASTNVKLSAARTIKAGETFDGKNLRYGRGVKCGGQKEGGTKDAVFILESGATLANAVIGADQNEGVHCQGPCTIRNVWFEDVCEDAITIRQSSGTSTITGGGAKSASDKVVQHNGGGLVKIDSYCVQDFGKLYRSCGNCGTQVKRQVQISNIIARNGKLLAGVNSNFGDVATIETKTNSYTSLTSVCDTFQGNNKGDEPTTLTKNKANARLFKLVGTESILTNLEILRISLAIPSMNTVLDPVPFISAFLTPTMVEIDHSRQAHRYMEPYILSHLVSTIAQQSPHLRSLKLSNVAEQTRMGPIHAGQLANSLAQLRNLRILGIGPVALDPQVLAALGSLPYLESLTLSEPYDPLGLFSLERIDKPPQVIAKNGKLLAGVNSNYGDVATIDTKSNSYTSVKSICDTFQGNSSGKEPTTLTKNQSNSNCKFRRQLFEPNFSGLAELGVVFDFTHSLPNMTSFTHYTSFDTTLNVSEPRVLQALVTYLFEANNTS